MHSLNQSSELLLLAVKRNKPISELVESIALLPSNLPEEELVNDTFKKAFWINIYNAFFQILRNTQKLQKPEIYQKKIIVIAGKNLSLDQIEHGILRKFRHKYTLGYLLNPFTPSWLKRLAVSKIDYRIHFALNCGAKSCPPISFYTPDQLESQLAMATLAFLESDTLIDPTKSEVQVTSLFKWYHNDFGGNNGIRKILTENLKQSFLEYKVVYQKYDWSENFDNFDENSAQWRS